MKAVISQERCDRSPFCPVRRMCPRGAVIASPEGFVIDTEKCTGCGVCMNYCPRKAVSMQ